MGMGGFFHNKHNFLGRLSIVWNGGWEGGGGSIFSWCETGLILIIRIWLELLEKSMIPLMT